MSKNKEKGKVIQKKWIKIAANHNDIILQFILIPSQ